MLRVGQVGTTEIAFGEDHPLGAQTGEVLIAEIVTGELAICPVLHN
jgi:hypothetical protein